MRAVVLNGIREMEVRDIPQPRIENDTDVLLRMQTIGVCGSDVHYYTTGRIGCQIVEYPFVVGHEGAAIVEDTGSAVTHVKPGDRVAIEPAVSCHDCDQCRQGREHTCRNLKFLGCPGQIAGCLCEYVVMPEECCYPIADSLTFEDAALAEPLSIGVYAVQQSIPLQGAKVGILGAGPIGMSVLLPALDQGAEAIYVTDRLEYRCEMARQNGATWTGNPDSTNVVQAIKEHEPLDLDVVFECCGQQEALDQATDLLKPGGKLMLIGIPEFDRYTFRADTARRHELCLQNVRRQNDCVQKALDLITQDTVDPSFMVTHRFSLDDTKQAFDLVDNYSDGVIKAMIHLD